MGAYTIKLYGSDVLHIDSTQVLSAFPTKANVEGLGDLVTVEWSIYSAIVTPELNGDDSTYVGGYTPGKNNFTYKLAIRKKVTGVGSGAGFDAIFPAALLAKKYKWLWLNNYPERPTYSGAILADTRVWAIAIESIEQRFDMKSGGLRALTLNVRGAYDL